MDNGEPTRIQKSLKEFRKEFADPNKVALIIMRSGESNKYQVISDHIKLALEFHGITGIRAEDKHYDEDPYWNTMTYMHGCGLGVAVFESIEGNDVPPNVALEAGYMLGLGKGVCLLEDIESHNPERGFAGQRYESFDANSACTTIREAISKWLLDVGLSQGGVE